VENQVATNYLEVRRALERNCAESPNLARQLSVLDGWQPIMGIPSTVFGGLRRMQNLTVNAETTIYTDSVYQNSIPTSNLDEKYIAPCT
jgi:hypothetical protein